MRNSGVVDGNAPASDNDWEKVKGGGDAGIQRWIDGQLDGRSCAIVLIGRDTAGRKWIDYEIKAAWNSGKGLLGVHIHNLKDVNGKQTTKGANPFAMFTMQRGGGSLSSLVKTYDPPHTDSTNVYAHIKNNLAAWIDAAIKIRNDWGR